MDGLEEADIPLLVNDCLDCPNRLRISKSRLAQVAAERFIYGLAYVGL
jgi:hypothetical protein